MALGKSFFVKLLALRYRLLGIEQFIIDPDREYTKLCESVGGTIIKIGPSSNTYINVLDIREESIEEEQGYLATKLAKLIGFFHLIFGELNEEEKAILEEKIILCYQEKGITFDDNSLYRQKKEGANSSAVCASIRERLTVLSSSVRLVSEKRVMSKNSLMRSSSRSALSRATER